MSCLSCATSCTIAGIMVYRGYGRKLSEASSALIPDVLGRNRCAIDPQSITSKGTTFNLVSASPVTVCTPWVMDASERLSGVPNLVEARVRR